MPYAGSSLGEGFRMAKQIAIGLVTTLVLACLPAGTEAQDRPVRLNGRVQWIAGQVMVVQLDTGPSVSVDIVRVPQDEYAALTPSERIVVIGVVTDSSRQVIATSIVRGDDIQAP
jgi:hypothetical protein